MVSIGSHAAQDAQDPFTAASCADGRGRALHTTTALAAVIAPHGRHTQRWTVNGGGRGLR